MTKSRLVSIVLSGICLGIQCRTSPSLTWQPHNAHRRAELKVGYFGRPGFELLSESETGITFANNLSDEKLKTNRVLLNGSGVAVGDVDGDGLDDLYFCGLDSSNALYKNLGGWKFQEITQEAGVACDNQFSSGAVFADVDGDADLDLLVTAIGETTKCFLNNGNGRFSQGRSFPSASGKPGATTMTLADIEGDGDLDLYIANYKSIRTRDIYTPFELGFANIVEQVGDAYAIAPKFKDHYRLEAIGAQLFWFETAESDQMFINNGEGQFEPAAFTEGRFRDEVGKIIDEASIRDWGLMARFQDIDADGDPDLYVCNDFDSPDRLWINDGKGHFRAIPSLAVRSTSHSSMAVDFSDIDRDGDVDFFVADMLSRQHYRRHTQMVTMPPSAENTTRIDHRPQYMRNTLFLDRGDGSYAEIAQFAGLQASEWTWSSVFMDVDLDGYEDMLVTTGNYHDAQDADTEEELRQRISSGLSGGQESILMYPRLKLQNIAFRNLGNLKFHDASRTWQFNTVDVSHGMALGDLDNDGDLDIVINRFNEAALVYRNETTTPRIAVRLKGLPPNTQGIGAKIRLEGGPVPQSKEVISGGHYLSGSGPTYVFAAGDQSSDLRIEVTWRSGKTSVVPGVRPDHIYEISESAAEVNQTGIAQTDDIERIFFEDASQLLSHVHHEEPFEDFRRQPLLPKRLSRAGPGVAWHDIDGDDNKDLIITSGRAGDLALFRGDRAGFRTYRLETFATRTEHEQTGVVGFTPSAGSSTLLVGHSNIENAEPAESYVLKLDFKEGALVASEKIDINSSSIGAMAIADYDRDGDLDLFVAGRSVPERYPEPASSQFLQNQNGTFTLDQANSRTVEQFGLVSGAVFSDYDGDGDSDLILAVEWGPVTLFENRDGVFQNVTKAWGLAEFRGWWNGVTTADLDGDGRLDIIAGNWGLNNKYHWKSDQAVSIYFSDFDNNGILDIIEAYHNPQMNKIVPERHLSTLRKWLPSLRIRNRNHKVFAQRDVHEIVGPKLKQAGHLQANTFAHMAFLNRETHFEPVALPDEAQFAPVFSVNAADYDGDGNEDLFLSQNFFASQMETPRSDAGRGLWLRGTGAGGLIAVPGQESGVKIYGEQRGAAVGDYNKDSRVDLVVTQNAHATKLYRNVRGKPGLRIRLVGPDGNRSAIGAMLRLVYDQGYGHAREIQAGSGYWSQNSAVQVMGLAAPAKAIWVRWPDGKTATIELPENINEVTLHYDGQLLTPRSTN
ncbi:FG-GAP-like repeat-containing protein [bacterium]|nr:FG-GAP-like repeat-containing protein [bacterium]